MTRRGLLSLLLPAVALVGCATRIDVEFDPAEDFSEYRTWAWLPVFESPSDGTSPFRAARDPELEEVVVARIERELNARGFPRSADQPPDFFVTYAVSVQQELVLRMEAPAMQHLQSLHDSPSYAVSTPVKVPRAYERGRLVIEVAEARGHQRVWRGEFETRVRGSFRSRVSDAVAELLARFPSN